MNAGRIDGEVQLSGGDDVLDGRGGQLLGNVFGGDGEDLLGGGGWDDALWGDGGNDNLLGRDGDDELSGDAGNDRLAGGGGEDLLTGGGGRDRFVLGRGGGDDIVTNFQNNIDRLDLSAFHLANFSAVAALASNAAGGLMLDFGSVGGGTVFLDGFSKANLNLADVTL